MKIFRLTLLALTLANVSGSAAMALNVDDKSMNNGNASSFNDPDEKMPVYLQSNGKPAPDSSDPSTIRYEYDPSSGSYIPHNANHAD